MEVIHSAFDTKLPLGGSWGYTKNEATVMESNLNNLPIEQYEHMIASMRAHLEMNLTLPEEQRYGSINLNEKTREQIQENKKIYDKVLYEVSAMKENDYIHFINEYKEGYGKEDFNMEDHFRRRKEATLVRLVEHWFDISKIV